VTGKEVAVSGCVRAEGKAITSRRMPFLGLTVRCYGITGAPSALERLDRMELPNFSWRL